MNISKKLFISFICFAYYQTYGHYTEPISLISEITSSDELHGMLQSKKPTIIKLYSQNCPYCNLFSKTFDEAAKKYKKITFLAADGKKLNAPKVIADFTKNEIKIPGYPSIIFIKNGVIDYQIGGNSEIFQSKLQKLLK